MLLNISTLFASSDVYNLIEITKGALEKNQQITDDQLYQAAKSAYKIEEYKDANSFLRYLVRELDNDQYKDELNLWVKKTKEEAEAALAQSLKVFKVLKKDPNKFSELANKYSQSISSETGGDMGFQPASQLAPEYFKAIKGKSAGYISPPVRTQFGYHIIKVLASKSYENINKALYSKLVFDSKRDTIIQKYFKKMRSGATIEIKTKNLQ